MKLQERINHKTSQTCENYKTNLRLYSSLSDLVVLLNVNIELANYIMLSALCGVKFLYSSKNVDWLSFFTQRVLDDLVSHLRIFRKALKACHEDHGMIQCDLVTHKRSFYVTESGKVREVLEDAFFVEEKKTENQSHFQDICCSVENEKGMMHLTTSISHDIM